MGNQAIWGELPPEIKKMCLLRQKQLSGCRDVSVFELSTYAGFVFEDAPEGSLFWVEVLGRSNFELFFQKYPKKKQTKKNK